MKKIISTSITLLCLASMTACGIKQETYESVVAEASQANENLESVNAELESANAELKSVNESVESLSSAYDSMSSEYAEYKESMSEYEKLSADEAVAREIQAQSIAESSRVAESESVAASIAESQEVEKRGYDTGITYNQLARTPDEFIGEKVKFKGKVVQVIEGDSEVDIRLATKGSYDNVLYCSYYKSIVPSRVLEDDTITIYGTSAGTISYQSTMGGQITIPAVLVDRIDQ